MKILANKVAIVTGASSGIGRATAKLFSREGANIVITARREDKLDQLVGEISAEGGTAKAFAGDVSDESFSNALVNFAVQEFGVLDVAINNAGTLGTSEAIENTELEDWNHTLSTNLTSAFLGAKYQLPVIAESDSGSIVFTSSFVGYTVGMPETTAYAASKAGIIGLTKSLAAEYGPKGVRVNALLPGGTETAMSREFAHTQDELKFVRNMHALKRLATPEEIAKSALYLASDLSSFTTGSALLADGGVSICKT